MQVKLSFFVTVRRQIPIIGDFSFNDVLQKDIYQLLVFRKMMTCLKVDLLWIQWIYSKSMDILWIQWIYKPASTVNAWIQWTYFNKIHIYLSDMNRERSNVTKDLLPKKIPTIFLTFASLHNHPYTFYHLFFKTSRQ